MLVTETRYVWNAKMPEWGYGLVRSINGKKLDILFESGGRRLLRQDFAALEEVDPSNIDEDSPLHDRLQWRRLESQKAFRAEFGRMLTRFLEIFPQGFADPEFAEVERAYKLKAIAYAGEHFTAEALAATRESGGAAAIIEQIMAATDMTTLIHPRLERPKLASIPAGEHDAFVDAFINLLHGAEDYDQRLTDFAAFLLPFGASKWTIATYFGFLFRPDSHPFVSPNVVRYAGKALLRELHYTAHPTPRTWLRIVELYDDVRDRLTAEGHAPTDTIDTQTFLWLGGPGYEQARTWRERQADPSTPEAVLDSPARPAPVKSKTTRIRKAKTTITKATPLKTMAPKTTASTLPKPPKTTRLRKVARSAAAPVVRTWTEADYIATVDAYFWMQEQEKQSRPFDRAEVYQDLELGALSEHPSQEIRRAMLHISGALAEVNRPHLTWLAPSANPDAELLAALVPVVRARLTEARKLYAPTAETEQLFERSHTISKRLFRRPSGRRHPEKTTQTITVWSRDPAVRAWVMRRANETCEFCSDQVKYTDTHGTFLKLFNPQPFITGGIDTVENTTALCPNCLQVAQSGHKHTAFIELLYSRVSELARDV
ncbi:MAG: hypothetical protein ACI8RZ_003143 [Myxococcota bacterium]|jgi:hypothetical protein